MLSQAELNAMPRRTPTGIAEATFERLARAMPVGPAGLPIPRGRAMYRPSEAELLSKIWRTAFGAYERKVIPWEQVQRIASILVADIERRYPTADMKVLQKYGHAREFTKLDVSLPRHLHFTVDLPETIVTIGKAICFSVNPIPGTDVALVPESTLEFFNRVTDLEQERSDMRFGTGAVSKWVTDYRRLHHRMPRWEEIEDTWPVIGNWLADERAKLEGKPRGR